MGEGFDSIARTGLFENRHAGGDCRSSVKVIQLALSGLGYGGCEWCCSDHVGGPINECAPSMQPMDAVEAWDPGGPMTRCSGTPGPRLTVPPSQGSEPSIPDGWYQW